MKHLLLSLLLLPVTAFSAAERFYISTYTGRGQGEGIYTGLIDSDTGSLGPITLFAKVNDPEYLAFSPDASHLYAEGSDKGGSVSAFTIAKGGPQIFLNSVPCGNGPAHLSVDHSGKNVLVANYGGGSIACIRINPDGSLGERTSMVTFQGSGPDPVRQQKPFAHFITTDSADRFVYACDLGTDHVWTYHFDDAAGRFLEPADVKGQVPSGSGSRHLAFGPGEDFAYVNGEMGCNITVFRHDKSTGALTPIQTLPLVPGAGPTRGLNSAEVVCHPSGKWLYVSSRGNDIIAVFAIGADGRLSFVQDAPSLVKIPRGFGIDPSGHWLIAGGQDDSRIAVLAIAQDSGKLTPAGQEANVPAPNCILFVPAR